MPVLSFRILNRDELPPFRQYLLPEAAQMVGSPGVFALGAVYDRCACGAAVAEVTGADAQLLSLFVDEHLRGRGMGGALLDALCAACADIGARTMEADYVLKGEDLAAMDALFLRRGGAPLVERSKVYRIHTSDVHDKRLLGLSFRPSFRASEAVCSFDALMPGQLQALEEPTIPDHLSFEGNRDRADPRLSLAWMHEERVLAYVLAGESADGGCVLLSAVSLPSAPGTAFLDLLQALLNLVYDRVGGDFPFYVSALTEHSDALIRRLTGDCRTTYVEHTTSFSLNNYLQLKREPR